MSAKKKIGRPMVTHCKRGHSLEPGNVRIDGRGYRRCIECSRIHYATQLGKKQLHEDEKHVS